MVAQRQYATAGVMLCAVGLGCVFCSREATFDVHPWQLEVPSQQRRFKTIIDKREAWTVRGGLSNRLFQFMQVPLALQVEGPLANLAHRGYGNRELLNGQALMAAGTRKDALLKQLQVADEPAPLLHPNMAGLYRSKVEELAAALQREDARLEASEMLRGLIDSIVLIPDEGQLRIELRGNLAAMLAAAQQQTKRSPDAGDLLVPVQLVAGACNQRYLQLWRAAA